MLYIVLLLKAAALGMKNTLKLRDKRKSKAGS
jgi:hypothetical protein